MTSAISSVGDNVGKAAKNVPPMVWVVVVGGGLAYAFLTSKRKSTNTGTSSTGDGGAPQALLYTGVGGAGTPNDSVTTPSSAQGPALTNEDWARRAKTYLIGRGDDPGIVNTAVDKFISAQALNGQEQALITQAIGGVGPPPMTLPPVTGQPGGGTPSTTYSPDNPIPGRVAPAMGSGIYGASIQGQQYTVQAGDTLTSIAQRAYGADPKNNLGAVIEGADEILNANWYKIKDAKTLEPGSVIYIPVIASNTFAHQGALALGSGAQPGAEKNVWEINAGLVTGPVRYGAPNP